MKKLVYTSHIPTIKPYKSGLLNKSVGARGRIVIEKKEKSIDPKIIEEYNKKLFEAENLRNFLDFLVHGRLAQDNIELLMMNKLIQKDKEVRKTLSDFFKYFRSIESDFEIMEEKDFGETEFISNQVYSLVEEIAFLRLPVEDEFQNLLLRTNKFKEEVKNFTEEQLKTLPKFKTKKITSSQLITKQYMMLIINLLFCKDKVRKFITLAQYKPDKIIDYVDKTINKLYPRVVFRAKEDFEIEIEGRLDDEYSNYVDSLSGINTASKITLNQVAMTYQKCPKRFMNFLNKLENDKNRK